MAEDMLPVDWRVRRCPYPGRGELEAAFDAAEVEVASGAEAA